MVRIIFAVDRKIQDFRGAVKCCDRKVIDMRLSRINFLNTRQGVVNRVEIGPIAGQHQHAKISGGRTHCRREVCLTLISVRN